MHYYYYYCVVWQGDRDFSCDAVKQYHEKVVPKVEKRPAMATHHIQQPK